MKSDSISSGVTTGAASISTLYANPCAVTGITLISDGTNDAQAYLLDSGVTLFGMKVDASVKPSERVDFSHPLAFHSNLQIWHVGTGAQIIVEYQQR